MLFNTSAVNTALNKAGGGDNYCPPSEVAVALYNAIPENIRALFRAPRGVQDSDGNYVGSVLQVAKGTMGRLHGPALEILAYQMLERIVAIDERTDEERMAPDADPGIIEYNGMSVIWDVRRYSSSMNKGRWQTIPDLSYYLDCTQKEMRNALAKEDNQEEEVNNGKQNDPFENSTNRRNQNYTEGF